MSVSKQGAVTLNFKYDSSTYKRKRRSKAKHNWPGWTTVFVIVRSDKKPRPLYLYGHNEKGNLQITFDDTMRLQGYDVSSKGSSEIVLDSYSVTRSLATPRYAGADWIAADPHPELKITFDDFYQWDAKNRDIEQMLALDRRSDEETAEKIKPKYEVMCRGNVLVNGHKAPFTVKSTVTFSEHSGNESKMTPRWNMYLQGTIEMKGRKLGLTGKDADANITLKFRTESYSELPKEHQAPKDLKDMPMGNDMLEGLDGGGGFDGLELD
jgi:hypothetical protein